MACNGTGKKRLEARELRPAARALLRPGLDRRPHLRLELRIRTGADTRVHQRSDQPSDGRSAGLRNREHVLGATRTGDGRARESRQLPRRRRVHRHRLPEDQRGADQPPGQDEHRPPRGRGEAARAVQINSERDQSLTFTHSSRARQTHGYRHRDPRPLGSRAAGRSRTARGARTPALGGAGLHALAPSPDEHPGDQAGPGTDMAVERPSPGRRHVRPAEASTIPDHRRHGPGAASQLAGDSPTGRPDHLPGRHRRSELLD